MSEVHILPERDLCLRKMTLADLDQVMAIEQAAFSEPWSRESFASEMASPFAFYLCAEAPKSRLLAGYCGWIRSFEDATIVNVAVRGELRGRGIGEAMLKDLLARGAAEGIENFTLEVRRSNVPALRLYEKLGFRTEGVRRNFYSLPTEDALIMWKRKSGSAV